MKKIFNNIKLADIKSYHLLISILFIAITLSLFNYGKPSNVTNLGGAYLIRAIELFNGDIPSYFTRGPFYPYLIAIAFKLGGVNFSIAHWLTHSIYFFIITIIFLIVNRLYGKWVSLISSVSIIISLSLFSVSWNFGVAFLWPLFILISFFLYLKASSDKVRTLAFLSGLFFGCALLTKESSIFYIYFPILLLLLLKDYRSKFHLYNFIFYSIGILLSISPWIIYLIFRDQNLSVMLGEFKVGGVSFFGYSSTIIYLLDIFLKGSLPLFKELIKNEPFFPLMLIGLFNISYSAFKSKNKSERVSARIFLSIFLPSIPMLFAYGLFMDGIRQIVLPVLLFHISFGVFIRNIFYLPKKYKSILPLFIFINFGVFYFINSQKINALVLKGPAYIFNLRLTGKFGLGVVPGGRFSENIQNSAVWSNNNIPKYSDLHIGGHFDHAIKFFTNGEYQYFGQNNPLYYKLSDQTNLLNPKLKTDQNDKNKNDYDNRIIQITTTKNFSEKNEEFRYRSQLYILYYQDLKDFLLKLTNEKKFIFKFNEEKIIFPIVEIILNDISQEIYSKDGVTILESTKSSFDFDKILYKANPKLLAKGKTLENSWLDVTRDLQWLKDNYPEDFDIYYSYLVSQGISLSKDNLIK